MARIAGHGRRTDFCRKANDLFHNRSDATLAVSSGKIVVIALAEAVETGISNCPHAPETIDPHTNCHASPPKNGTYPYLRI